MSKFALALLVVAGVAHAEDWVEAPTSAGGKIVLTRQTADWCPKGFLLGYVETSKQDVIYGCWAKSNDRIHMRFGDDIMKVYDLEGWEYKTDGKGKGKK